MEEKKKIIIKKQSSTEEAPQDPLSIKTLIVKKPKKKAVLKPRPCRVCGTIFEPKRHNSWNCSEKCRKKIIRQRNTKTFENGFKKCTCCLKNIPLSLFWKTQDTKEVCQMCIEAHKKKCPFCSKTFYHRKKERIYCSIRCAALTNQKIASQSNVWQKADLYDILEDLVPLIQRDTPISEACEVSGWSKHIVDDYLYWKQWNEKEHPDVFYFRQQIRAARNFLKITARKVLLDTISTKKDFNAVKFVLANRDKRYKWGDSEEGNGGGRPIVIKFASGPSPFMQPEDNLWKDKADSGEDFDN